MQRRRPSCEPRSGLGATACEMLVVLPVLEQAVGSGQNDVSSPCSRVQSLCSERRVEY